MNTDPIGQTNKWLKSFALQIKKSFRLWWAGRSRWNRSIVMKLHPAQQEQVNFSPIWNFQSAAAAGPFNWIFEFSLLRRHRRTQQGKGCRPLHCWKSFEISKWAWVELISSGGAKLPRPVISLDVSNICWGSREALENNNEKHFVLTITETWTCVAFAKTFVDVGVE